ncbi:MAG: hypothetical protein AAFN30_07155, partial [Actinomycetota bacterium]
LAVTPLGSTEEVGGVLGTSGVDVEAAAAGTFLDGLFGDGASTSTPEVPSTPPTSSVDPSGVTASNDTFTS